MKLQSRRIIMFALVGVLFLGFSSVYAETAEEYFKHGVASYNQGNVSQAISDFTKSIEIDPSHAETYNCRGLVYGKTGNLTQAISDLTKALEINPNDVVSYINRGPAFYQVKEYDKAWADVHKAEELGHSFEPKFLDDLKKASGRDK